MKHYKKIHHLQYFKNYIEAIDGSHIPIPKPSNYQESCINRKGYHSLLLHSVTLPDKSFSNVYSGEPGSLHHSRVLQKSLWYRNAEDPNFIETYYLLGESAYPNLNWIIILFRDNGTFTETQLVEKIWEDFNYLRLSIELLSKTLFVCWKMDSSVQLFFPILKWKYALIS